MATKVYHFMNEDGRALKEHKTRVKLFPYFTRHHLISTYTNPLGFAEISFYKSKRAIWKNIKTGLRD